MKGSNLGGQERQRREKDWLEDVIKKTMAFLADDSRSFTPTQQLRSHKIKTMLLKIEELVEKGKFKKAKEFSYDIDGELFMLLFE